MQDKKDLLIRKKHLPKEQLFDQKGRTDHERIQVQIEPQTKRTQKELCKCAL